MELRVQSNKFQQSIIYLSWACFFASRFSLVIFRLRMTLMISRSGSLPLSISLVITSKHFFRWSTTDCDENDQARKSDNPRRVRSWTSTLYFFSLPHSLSLLCLAVFFSFLIVLLCSSELHAPKLLFIHSAQHIFKSRRQIRKSYSSKSNDSDIDGVKERQPRSLVNSVLLPRCTSRIEEQYVTFCLDIFFSPSLALSLSLCRTYQYSWTLLPLLTRSFTRVLFSHKTNFHYIACQPETTSLRARTTIRERREKKFISCSHFDKWRRIN